MAPVELFSASPGGRGPAVIKNVYGGAPPEGVSVEEYAVPAWPVLLAQPTVISGQVRGCRTSGGRGVCVKSKLSPMLFASVSPCRSGASPKIFSAKLNSDSKL